MAKGRSLVSVVSLLARTSRIEPPMTTGIRIRLMRNALLRTSVANSDWATIRTLGIASRSRDTDKDVLEGRPCHLEVIDGRARGQAREKRLRISVQTNFLHLSKVVDRLHIRHTGQRGAPLRGSYPHRVGAVVVLNVLQCAVEHLASAINHENAIAHSFRGGHVVRAEHYRRPTMTHFQHRVFEDLRVHRIET